MADNSSNKYYVNGLVIAPNYADNPNLVDQYSTGVPTYTSYDKKYIIVAGEWRQWTFAIRTFVCESPQKYNVYARCSKQGSQTTTFYSIQSLPVEPTEELHKDFYFFKIGELTAIGSDNKRTFNPLFGANITGPDGMAVSSPEEEIFSIDKSQDISHDQSDRDKWIATTDLPVVSEKSFQAPVVGPMKQTSLGSGDWHTDSDINFENGLQLKGNLIDGIIPDKGTEKPSDTNVYSASRSKEEFLSRLDDDSAAGIIKFMKAAFYGDFIDSMIAGKGAGIYANGRAQFESVEVRGYIKVLELIYNRIAAEESDRVFTEAGTIDHIEKIDDTTYKLTMRKEWENDFTAFREGDVLRGIINNLAKKGEYTTSWLRVLSVNTAANTITVSIYPDSEVDTGANVPPTELMVLQRWGNSFDTDRQSTWYLSSREGRIVWLTGVTKPILDDHNYASFYGKPVHLSVFEGQSIDYNEPYIYVKGLLAENIIQVDHQGNIIKNFRDRGLWEPDPEEPYRNTATIQDDVWHLGAKWRCLVDETKQEPAWNATDWQQIEGNKNITCELYPTNGEYFYADEVDFILHWDVKYGYININIDVQPGDVEWTRDSGDITADNLWAVQHAGIHNDLHITNADIGESFDVNGVTFKVKIFIRDTERVYQVEETFKV